MSCADDWKKFRDLSATLTHDPKDPNARAALEDLAAHCVGAWADEARPNPYSNAKELLIQLKSRDPEIDPDLAERVRRARQGRDDWGPAP